jgi:hypothetical protein
MQASDILELTRLSIELSADAVLWVNPDEGLLYFNDAVCIAAVLC